MRLISIILFSMFSLIVLGQNIETELQLGVTDFQNGKYADALMHLEKVVNEMPTEVNNSELRTNIFLMCSTSAHVIEDYRKSMYYNNMLLAIQGLPTYYQILALKLQLTNYDVLGMDEESEKLINELQILLEIKDLPSESRLVILEALTSYYFNHTDYHKVANCEKLLPDTVMPTNMDESTKQAMMIAWNTIYMTLGESFLELNDTERALRYFSKALENITSPIEAIRPLVYRLMVDGYIKQGDAKQALKYQKKSMELDEELSHTPQRYADELLQLGTLYEMNELYHESLECFGKADSIYLSLDNMDYHAYAQSHLYHILNLLGDKKRYMEIREYLESVLSKQEIKDAHIALIIASKLSDFLQKDGEYQKALDICYENIKKGTSLFGKDSMELYSLYYSAASLCLIMGDFDCAQSHIDKAELLFTPTDKNSTDYYNLILLESELLQDEGRIGEAISLVESIAVQLEADLHTASLLETKSNCYSALSNLYAGMGNYDRSFKYAKMALELTEKIAGKESPLYAHHLQNISVNYALTENVEKAIECAQRACSLFEYLYGKNHRMYYFSLKRLAGIYKPIDSVKSKMLSKECIELSKRLFGENSNEYAENLIYSVDVKLQPTQEDLEILSQGLKIKRICGRNNDNEYLSALSWYATLLWLKQDWRELYCVSSELLEGCKNYAASNFLNLTFKQREDFWTSTKQALGGIESYATHHTQYAVESGNYDLIDEFGGLAYDARLLKKGLLLSSAQHLDEFLYETDDSLVNNIRKQIRILKYRQRNLKSSDFIEKEQLEYEINDKERKLLEVAARQGDFTNFMSIAWRDIQKNLQAGEVAIEFFSYPIQDDIQYGATWLTCNRPPTVMGLFREKELEQFEIGGETVYDYTNPGMYKTIWAVLETFSEIKNAHTIYFSADNLLNTICIENLCDSTGRLATEKHQLFRLSSTRELVKRNNPYQKNQGVVLYGGLDYDASVSELLAVNENRIFKKALLTSKFVKPRSIRSKADYLPWTLSEVQSIAQIMQASQMHIYSGVNGTEESFKLLSSKVPGLLHIATHGFYYDVDDVEDKIMSNPTKYRFLSLYKEERTSVETLAMRGTGLLFSGANLTLSGQTVPESIEDGILTAEELSQIKFDGIDLVVLSACETGLGSFASEEGVFGLQRGFKIAGVNSLLMSLWEVDDKATSLFMQYFYEYYIQLKSKTGALKSAQSKLRLSEKYFHPLYWAGWILLDALE